MPVIVELDSEDPDFTQRVTLEGTTYTLGFLWNGRESSWYLSILTEAEEPILMGVKLVPRWATGLRCKDPRMPPGQLTLEDTSGQDAAPGRDELGERCLLVYYSADELAALLAAV